MTRIDWTIVSLTERLSEKKASLRPRSGQALRLGRDLMLTYLCPDLQLLIPTLETLITKG
jgi:hypothetical protein